MSRLNIYDPRERRLVRVADMLLSPGRLFRRPPERGSIRSVLCLRLERIGDLLMTMPALAELHALAPEASVDLAVGRWNADLARAIPGISHVELLDPAWLSRGATGQSWPALLRSARRWRSRAYDLVINFEPDIRTNALAAWCGARIRAGFAGGGGAGLLDVSVDFDPALHTSANAVALVRKIFGEPETPVPRTRLVVPDEALARAEQVVRGARPRPIVGVHVSGGRAIKQWPEERFREIVHWLVRERGAVVVLTGTAEDAAKVRDVRAGLEPDAAIDATGISILETAAVLERLDLLVTGDTGPMHLAHAVGTPVVAVFGPSDPGRYGPTGVLDRIVSVQLPCSPCNRIRRPPARCQGHTPDCLRLVTTSSVQGAIDDVLRARRPTDGTAA